MALWHPVYGLICVFVCVLLFTASWILTGSVRGALLDPSLGWSCICMVRIRVHSQSTQEDSCCWLAHGVKGYIPSSQDRLCYVSTVFPLQ
jgi:hypothetical protein